MAIPEPLERPPRFSLTFGGPLYKMLWRSRPASSVPALLRRQAAISVFVCWVPLAVLSLVQARPPGGMNPSFFRDIETQVRFLVSLPVLILAEMIVNRRIRPITGRFVERHIVISRDLPKYNDIIDAAVRLNNSAAAEILLVVFVYTVGMWLWRHQIATDISSWYASSQGGEIHLTMAGYWFTFVSIPAFQFIVLRWYMQFLIWFSLVFRVSRLKLRLRSLHPDRAGGLGFVGTSSMAFAPLLFAHSALLSGQITGRILYHGESLSSSDGMILGFVCLSVSVVLAPLFFLVPLLIRAKRKGLARYGNFASLFVTDFDQRWLKSKGEDDPMLAGHDIQSLADLSNSFAVVRGMRYVPIGGHDVSLLFGAAIAPFLPLLLTTIPVDQLVLHAIKMVF
jgi:hypothetical protein